MSLGSRLRELRIEKGRKLQDIAEMFNIGKSTVSDYENDKTKHDYEFLKKIAAYFEVITDYLLGISKITKPKTKEQMVNELIQVLIDTGELEPGEELTDEKRERLLNMVRKAFELSKL